ncbi:MAG: short-chain dehydrogenase [Moraxellaceae bacterium]|jgi:NAD(P)-dependent dehydrogenase (short-subunit alcohol dehydrogenase family)|nr:short-chain dehydrogenase [Moraxellaceae bacterium]
MSTLSGKTIAITGGARGIGYETAKLLLERGAKVVIGDIDEAQLKEAAAELGIATFSRLDVTDPDSFRAFLDTVEHQLGALDVLVNNAGIMPTGHAHEESDAVSRRQVEINLLGVIYGTKQALGRMLPRRSGHIINVASLAGELPYPGVATYCATKFAVIGYSDTVRMEYRNSGVNISTVRPTFTNTELTAGTGGVRGVRNAEPREIADAVARLIVKPRARVRVTKAAGTLTVAGKILPEWMMRPVTKLLGTDKVFLETDKAARQAYLARAENRS